MLAEGGLTKAMLSTSGLHLTSVASCVPKPLADSNEPCGLWVQVASYSFQRHGLLQSHTRDSQCPSRELGDQQSGSNRELSSFWGIGARLREHSVSPARLSPTPHNRKLSSGLHKFTKEAKRWIIRRNCSPAEKNTIAKPVQPSSGEMHIALFLKLA